jgi:hypothetical protein
MFADIAQIVEAQDPVVSTRNRMPFRLLRMWAKEILKSRKRMSMPDAATGLSGIAAWWYFFSFSPSPLELGSVLAYNMSAASRREVLAFSIWM